MKIFSKTLESATPLELLDAFSKFDQETLKTAFEQTAKLGEKAFDVMAQITKTFCENGGLEYTAQVFYNTIDTVGSISKEFISIAENVISRAIDQGGEVANTAIHASENVISKAIDQGGEVATTAIHASENVISQAIDQGGEVAATAIHASENVLSEAIRQGGSIATTAVQGSIDAVKMAFQAKVIISTHEWQSIIEIAKLAPKDAVMLAEKEIESNIKKNNLRHETIRDITHQTSEIVRTGLTFLNPSNTTINDVISLLQTIKLPKNKHISKDLIGKVMDLCDALDNNDLSSVTYKSLLRSAIEKDNIYIVEFLANEASKYLGVNMASEENAKNFHK